MKLSEVWSKSGSVLDHNGLSAGLNPLESQMGYMIQKGLVKAIYGRTSSDKVFAAIIRGRLPLGDVQVKAIHLKDDGTRESAFILPQSITNDDPQSDLRAVMIVQLDTDKETAFRRDGDDYRGVCDVVRGRYYISLQKDDKELCGSELTIK